MKKMLTVPHSSEWRGMYETEVLSLKGIFGSTLLDIQHIGSTAVSDLLAKPIIDIAILIESYKDADMFVRPLEKLGYVYKPDMSSMERHFFQEGNPIQFHLSIAYKDRGGYWDRQILFRDYLVNHEEARREYESLKAKGIPKDEFVQKILALAQQ